MAVERDGYEIAMAKRSPTNNGGDVGAVVGL